MTLSDPPSGIPEPKAKHWRRLSNQFINHPFWTTAGAVIGIVGLVLSVFQIWQALQSPAEDLSVSMTSIGGPEPVHAANYLAPTKTILGETDFEANPIDITLQNDGGEPSLITQIIADVTYFEKLQDCSQSGAGPVQVTADYSIKVPNQPATAALGPHREDVRFEVKPHTVDRMSLTVGPEFESANNFPFVMGVHLTLVHDDGKPLDAGTYALVTNHKAIEANIENSSSEGCAKNNLEKLDEAQQVATVSSAELGELRTSYQALVG